MSFNVFQIPFVATPQSFQIQLGNTLYNIINKWNATGDDGNGDGGGWVLDIEDQNNIPLACNIPLITGADCLDGLAYLGIGGQLIVVSSGSSPTDIPTFANLGVDSNVYFLTEVTS